MLMLHKIMAVLALLYGCDNWTVPTKHGEK